MAGVAARSLIVSAAALKQIDGMRQKIDDAGERLARPHVCA